MLYKNALFYFLSGTGNSYQVAAWLREYSAKQGISSSVHSIDRNYRAYNFEGEGQNLIGFVLPTHGFTAPWPMIKFVLSLSPGHRTHAIIMATRAGTKLGPMFLPGFQGTAGYLLALLLILKGFIVRGVQGVDMPSNWTALHWGISKPNSEAIITRAKPKVLNFISAIISGNRRFGLGGLIELVLGILVIPISFGYLLYGRIQFAKIFFASDKCNGCGVCASYCMVGAIKMRGGKPYWTYKCESCMRCMNYCPTQAVEASQPLIIAFSFVSGIPFTHYLINILGRKLPVLIALNNGIPGYLIQYAYFLASVILVYILFSFLNRFKIFSRIFKLLTLTHYYRRYHAPGVKLSDLSGK